MVVSGPCELWALVRADAPYLDAMRAALRWLHEWTHSTSDLPDPLADWERWYDFIRATPNRFKGLVLRAQGMEACRQQVVAALDGLYRALQGLAPPRPPERAQPGNVQEACIPCQRVFASRVAWAGHAARMHGYRNKAFLLGQSKLCRACGRMYGTVGRLRRHLTASPRCIRAWGAFGPSSEVEPAATVLHPQMPPIPVPGSFSPSRALAPAAPDAVSAGLLQALQELPEVDEATVWEAVSDFIEPLQVLRATVDFWRQGAPDNPEVHRAAENVQLLFDPDLIGEPSPSQHSKARKQAFTLGVPPDWSPLLPFTLAASTLGPSLDLASPPPFVLQPHSATSGSLRMASAYATWLEQACSLIAKGLAIALEQNCAFRILCPGLELSLGPAYGWLKAAGFVFWQGGLQSSNSVSPEFAC